MTHSKPDATGQDTDFRKDFLKWLQPDGQEFPQNYEEVRHLGAVLRSMIDAGNLDEPGPSRDAALFVADKLVECLTRHTADLNWLREAVSERLGSPESELGC